MHEVKNAISDKRGPELEKLQVQVDQNMPGPGQPSLWWQTVHDPAW